MHPNNLLSDLPLNLTAEVFETLAKGTNIHIERIVSLGHSTTPGEWYDQADNEWVILLQGAARIGFDDGSTAALQPGDYLNIPAHQKHRVEWTEAENPTIWLAIHYH
ncbi:hypothetical protein A9Q99_06465 [Gammaproteobacteria bacterium 45_16_T64]|nr:hypothetical protein A9Q99_06465 [Gammaproteobacteria bacterium 45_16_T64]